jgi:hypothetical protein
MGIMEWTSFTHLVKVTDVVTVAFGLEKSSEQAVLPQSLPIRVYQSSGLHVTISRACTKRRSKSNMPPSLFGDVSLA